MVSAINSFAVSPGIINLGQQVNGREAIAAESTKTPKVPSASEVLNSENNVTDFSSGKGKMDYGRVTEKGDNPGGHFSSIADRQRENFNTAAYESERNPF